VSDASTEVSRRGDVAILTLHGRITESETRPVEKQLLDLCEEGVVKLVMDVSDVPLISSAGLGALMVAYKEGKTRGGFVRLVGAQPLVRQILETTKLTKLFGLYDSIDEALAAT